MVILLAATARADEVDDLIRSQMQQHHVPGVACQVWKNGQPVKTFYGGVANLEWNAPVGPDTVFEIGSISKQFAAASILLLVQQGKLSVDDNISKYLTNTPSAWANIKIRHLLSHTSGIHSYDDMEGFELRQHLTQAQFIGRLARRPLDFQPGEKWVYCNAGYNLLGYIVENVSGEDYLSFLRKNIFIPLGMTNSAFRDSMNVVSHRAAGYRYEKGKYYNRDYDITDLFSAGTIVSTVSDLAKWDEALANSGLLAESSKNLWWTPARMNDGRPVPVSPGGSRTYGFGWFLDTLDGHKNIGHGGITSGFSAANELYPDDRLFVIVLSNTDEGGFAGQLAGKIARICFRKF
ncbi:MAG TPA: serine hydrolase domain-containing protein [Verrucomicrobiae bacterium]|jgi:CubicO group peptidase (beta-lactamase class C family)|nr:serine hydrolase domain-containing protein [Verrucomicrobiae bacterium]